MAPAPWCATGGGEEKAIGFPLRVSGPVPGLKDSQLPVWRGWERKCSCPPITTDHLDPFGQRFGHMCHLIFGELLAGHVL